MVGALKNGKVTWHMMPMYGVTEMKEKWSDSLAPYVSGKSCINFKTFSELPEDALLDIVQNGTPMFKKEMGSLLRETEEEKVIKSIGRFLKRPFSLNT